MHCSVSQHLLPMCCCRYQSSSVHLSTTTTHTPKQSPRPHTALQQDLTQPHSRGPSAHRHHTTTTTGGRTMIAYTGWVTMLLWARALAPPTQHLTGTTITPRGGCLPWKHSDKRPHKTKTLGAAERPPCRQNNLGQSVTLVTHTARHKQPEQETRPVSGRTTQAGRERTGAPTPTCANLLCPQSISPVPSDRLPAATRLHTPAPVLLLGIQRGSHQLLLRCKHLLTDRCRQAKICKVAPNKATPGACTQGPLHTHTTRHTSQHALDLHN